MRIVVVVVDEREKKIFTGGIEDTKKNKKEKPENDYFLTVFFFKIEIPKKNQFASQVENPGTNPGFAEEVLWHDGIYQNTTESRYFTNGWWEPPHRIVCTS
mgnify:CR=1 FL=1